eukprot:CAMPEP_0181312406 /NCGR_PEP_ID=MMETSP1101-20121128/13678_1 /TAXON_ID=46948 /ORGANISM="Rhodomonas abbreviata, Strain Caron Lab Isolate" /LENGTH=200 /DNA_ID=CAMNT_0023419251 /DNA_START=90 /DNA_END=693 /DNA_ORIENTATION=+
MFSCVSSDLLRIVDSAEDDRTFHAAVATGDLAHVRRLLQGGADPRESVDGGKTMLHEAARLGHVDVLRELLEKGADVNDIDAGGRTPLMDAAWEGHAEAVQLLLEHGADSEIENEGGGTALKVAMRRRHPQGSAKQKQGDEVVRILRAHRETLQDKGKDEHMYRDYKWHRDPDWKWPNQRAGAEGEEEGESFDPRFGGGS